MIKETKKRNIVGKILIVLCIIPFISMFVNPLLTVPTGMMILYFLGRNAYILLKKEEDTKIEGWKIFLFYLVEVLVCIIVSFIVIWIFDEGDDVWLPVIVYPILVILLTLLFPAKKFFKNYENEKKANTSIDETMEKESIDETYSQKQDEVSNTQKDEIIAMKNEEMENHSMTIVEKEYSSLYEELLEKCNPQNFMSPYDAEKVKYANELFAELMDYSKEDEEKLRDLRSNATHLLSIKFSSSYIWDFLLSYCNPALYFNLKPYPKEYIDMANEYYNKLLSSKDDILALEKIKEETKELLEWSNQQLKTNSSGVNQITEAEKKHNEKDKYKIYLILLAILLVISGIVNIVLTVERGEQNSVIYSLYQEMDNIQNTREKLYQEKDSIQNELNSIRSVVSNFGNTCPIFIKDVKIGNFYNNGNVETDYGEPIYSANTMFLHPKIEYVGTSSEKIKVYWKLYYPSGKWSRGKSSPTNYSFCEDLSIHPGKNTIIGHGWGGSKKGNYSSGEYTMEFYYSDSLIYTHKFTIY